MLIWLIYTRTLFGGQQEDANSVPRTATSKPLLLVPSAWPHAIQNALGPVSARAHKTLMFDLFGVC